MPDDRTTYHLYRKYPTAPVWRWACAVIEDPKADDGFRVVDTNPIVADTWFLHRVHDGLTGEAEVTIAGEDSKASYRGLAMIVPGDPDYFDRAVRVIPNVIHGPAPKGWRAP